MIPPAHRYSYMYHQMTTTKYEIYMYIHLFIWKFSASNVNTGRYFAGVTLQCRIKSNKKFFQSFLHELFPYPF